MVQEQRLHTITVFQRGRIFQGNDVFALRAGIAKLGARGGTVSEQQFTKLRVHPGLGHNPSTIVRAPLVCHQLGQVFDVTLGDQVLLLEHLQ